jgi:hypothetical protein
LAELGVVCYFSKKENNDRPNTRKENTVETTSFLILFINPDDISPRLPDARIIPTTNPILFFQKKKEKKKNIKF